MNSYYYIKNELISIHKELESLGDVYDESLFKAEMELQSAISSLDNMEYLINNLI